MAGITGLCACKGELWAYHENKWFSTYGLNKSGRRWAGSTSSLVRDDKGATGPTTGVGAEGSVGRFMSNRISCISELRKISKSYN